jgi:hypothetical protein
MPILARFTTAALLLALTACAGSHTAPPAPPAAPREAPPTRTAPATPAASTPPPAAAPQAADAADGRHLASCEDADCEVEIQSGDRLRIAERFGVRRLTIGSLRPDGVTITLSGSSGALSVEGTNVSTSGTCVNGRCRDEGELSLAPGSPGRINDIRLELPRLSGDRAVLRLTPQ